MNTLFSLEFHGVLSKCSTFAVSISYSLVTAVQPSSSELSLCPLNCAFPFPCTVLFFSQNNLSRHNLNMHEILLYTLCLSYFLYICFESNPSMSSKICCP